jgi:uncharacterized protein YbaR (Trm112 family)
MPIPPDLLAILVSPDTHRPVRPLAPSELASLNARIAGGQVKNRAGNQVTEPLEEGLRPDGEQVVYPVRTGIPNMLTGEGIPWQAVDAPNPAVR